jgi:hypothetical protein
MKNESDSNCGDHITQSCPPSHILQDGRFIYLPEPTEQERSKFLERSIARHKILNEEFKEGDDDASDVDDETKREETEKATATQKEASTKIKVHPLEVASARLQANGIAELSKAINLTNLVSSGNYFGLSNIVNPNLEVDKEDDKTVEVPVNAQDMTLRALYLCKRKRAQFERATETLDRHQQRLASALATQQILDHRLLSLRPRWRLVAPEHGTRAKPHATRPTEVIAIDVDVYDQDRTGGGVRQRDSFSSSSQWTVSSNGSMSTVGLARLVPRYATVEFAKDYKAATDVTNWKAQYDDDMASTKDVEDSKLKNKTRAEPFAVADPTLGKVDVDFDPEKVPMLSLQLDIEKDSTGFRQSARLSPLTTLEENAAEDEQVVVALQHSLFCASLFESIRNELTAIDSNDDHNHVKTSKQHDDVWLSSANEEHFLPPPSRMVGSRSLDDREALLAVVHCHEGEVKVQLDSEYALTIKLVEAGTAVGSTECIDDKGTESSPNMPNLLSGSHSPQQLHILCRALLLHAQDVYHRHSIQCREHSIQKKKEENGKPKLGLEMRKKKDEMPTASILKSCVSVGSRMLLERRIRWALTRVSKWLSSQSSDDNTMVIEWLPLPVFGNKSQFVLSYENFLIDVKIEKDEVIVTRFGDHGDFRKVVFHSEGEFETFIKLEFYRRLTASNGNNMDS